MKYAVILTYRGFDPDVDDIARKLGRRFGVRDVGSGFDGATRDIEFGAFGSKTRAVEFVKDARRLNFHARIREDAHNNPPLTRVKQVGPNMTEIRHGEITALYSYETPVALDTPSGLYRTATHFSNTTARHISKWGAKTAPKISQEKIELAIQRGVDPQTLGAERGPRRNPGDVHIDIDSHKQNPARIAYRVGEVKIYWDSALKEYEVVGKGEQRGNGYFTSDKQDAIDTAKTIAGGHQPNPGKFNDTVEELLYVVDHDQTMGDASGPLGWMGLVSGLLLPEANELAKFHGIELDDSDTADYDWPLNAIIIEDDQGFIDVTTYKSNREAIRVWRELEKELEGFETE